MGRCPLRPGTARRQVAHNGRAEVGIEIAVEHTGVLVFDVRVSLRADIGRQIAITFPGNEQAPRIEQTCSGGCQEDQCREEK